MSLDIRVPTGLLFVILGIILAVYGLVTGQTSPEMYSRSLGININLWWGLVLGVFGAAMLLWARWESVRKGPRTPPSESPLSAAP